MAKFLVKGRLRPARKADLAAQLAQGTLAEGAPFQADLLRALREGHASGDVAYFVVDAEGEGLGRQRDVLEGFFTLERVVPVGEVDEDRFDALEGEDSLPEWAGVD